MTGKRDGAAGHDQHTGPAGVDLGDVGADTVEPGEARGGRVWIGDQSAAEFQKREAVRLPVTAGLGRLQPTGSSGPAVGDSAQAQPGGLVAWESATSVRSEAAVKDAAHVSGSDGACGQAGGQTVILHRFQSPQALERR